MFPWQIKEPGLQKGLERAPAAASPTMTPQWDGMGTPSLPEGSAQLKESPALKGPLDGMDIPGGPASHHRYNGLMLDLSFLCKSFCSQKSAPVSHDLLGDT